MSGGEQASAGSAAGRNLGEEAGRLFEALQQATGAHAGLECRVCPICQGVSRLRDVRPEAVQHLATAAAELVAAFREVLATPPAPERTEAAAPRAPAPSESPPVQRIEISE